MVAALKSLIVIILLIAADFTLANIYVPYVRSKSCSLYSTIKSFGRADVGRTARRHLSRTAHFFKPRHAHLGGN